MTDPATRFSNRVADYLRYRPHYPSALVAVLRERCGLVPAHAVADVGSGTGILSELLLANGNSVFAVEPNQAMRAAAESLHGATSGFHSVDGSAEATGLADASVEFVVAAQAFHWFEPEAARCEFVRILRPNGWVVLVWNERRTEESAFLSAYEALLHQHGTDYVMVDHRNIDESKISSFFRAPFDCVSLDNVQWLDRDGLAGRLRSCSYVPAEGEAGYDAMMADLDTLFDTHRQDGRVAMTYDTKIYFASPGFTT